jgi:predicted dehydrogenase
MILPAPPVGVGVLGCGRVLFGPYQPEIRDLAAAGRARLVGACDVRPEVEAAVRAAFDVERFTTRPEEVVGAADVDVVMVLTPPADHAALAIAALESGKHVLVEKPMALDVASARRMVDAAQAADRRLVCAPFVTLSATHRRIADLLAAGTIGRILSVRAIAGTDGPSWGRWFYEGPGGGPLFDLGVYSLTAIVNLVGPVRRVTAVSGIVVPERVVDGEPMRPTIADSFQVALDFGGGTLGVLGTGFTMASLRTPAFELFGSDGTIQMLGADWEPAGFDLWRNEIGAWELVSEADPGWNYAAGLRHLVEHLVDGAPLAVPPELALHVLEVMLMAAEAGRDGMARTLTTTVGGPIPTAAGPVR